MTVVMHRNVCDSFPDYTVGHVVGRISWQDAERIAQKLRTGDFSHSEAIYPGENPTMREIRVTGLSSIGIGTLRLLEQCAMRMPNLECIEFCGDVWPYPNVFAGCAETMSCTPQDALDEDYVVQSLQMAFRVEQAKV